MSSTGPWHRWFAWRPVRTEQHGWRWLRTVERALHYPADIPFAPNPYWVYRPTPNNRKEVNHDHQPQALESLEAATMGTETLLGRNLA